ncbi:MAG: DNA internalization-related competence protein ComEC/Rec2 [Clostridiales bacterium]|nr:DNA internalization-related competence protein ComEC/Rec2 [Clostridiales bacterium]
MRKLAWFSVFFAVAALLAVYLLPSQWWMAAAVLALVPMFASLSCSGKLRTRILLASVGLVLGFVWCHCYQTIFVLPAERTFGEGVSFSGIVQDTPTETEYGVSVTLSVDSEAGANFLAKVYLDAEYQSLSPGDRIAATGTIKTANIVRNETVYYNAAKGIYAIISSVKEITITEKDSTPLYLLPAVCASAIQQKLQSLFTGDALGIVQALMTGDQDLLSDSLYTALQRAGVAHIVSVSGLHVMLFVQILLSFPGSQRRKRILVLPVLVFFALLTGCKPAIVRAVLMESLLLLAPIFGRENDAPTSLSFALLVLLLQNPYAIAGIGLQLSFLSVLGIELAQPRLHRALESRLEPIRHKRRLFRLLYGVIDLFSTSCGALLLSTPLCACYFGSVSLVGVFTNLLVLPVLGLLFGQSLLCVLCSFFWWPAAELLAIPCKYISLYISGVTRAVSSFNFAALSIDVTVYALWLVFCYALMVLAVRWRPLRKHPALPVCTGVISLLCAIVIHIQTTLSAPVTIAAIDVGQGQCIAAFSEDKAIAIDCGGNEDNPGDTLADYLQGLNRSSLNALILTHYDSDHTNGVEELLSRIAVETLYLPEFDEPQQQSICALAEEYQCEIVFVTEDETASFGCGTLSLFAPVEQEDADSNNAGISLLLSYGTLDFLVTGDMDIATETALVEREQLSDIEYLMVGHHGSKYATGDALLSALTPEVAVISVGYNTYGHPTEETLARLAAWNCTVYRTDEDGTVLLRLGESE